MTIPRWLLAISIALTAWVTAAAPARAASIRDGAGMFRPEAVEKAKARLDRLERASGIPVVIETIEALPGVEKQASKESKERAVNEEADRRDRAIRDEGIYILISKRDRVISNTHIRARLERILPEAKRDAIRKAFVEEFRHQDFDGGLNRAVQTIEECLEGVRVSNRRAQGPAGVPAPLGRGGRAGGGSSMLGTILLIGLGILAVLVLLRILGGLFGRSAGAGYPNQMGGLGRPGMGPGPGGGPGSYGGPGYGGGRGGGFFSGLLGGLGGAMAGNWLYDQMSGRHGQMSSGTAYPTDEPTAGLPDQGDDAIIGSEDHGGRGESWDDGGGTDTGGGDWGGGDPGGGGDWGGGGGDWGGGGGDWGGGGGDGGGDW
ncbi:MAG TPA: TPM domain-containing protein [Isosphaeraceae bacterium]|nr:TPM domain-containing protein [Isosphaeraceae bacterium]